MRNLYFYCFALMFACVSIVSCTKDDPKSDKQEPGTSGGENSIDSLVFNTSYVGDVNLQISSKNEAKIIAPGIKITGASGTRAFDFNVSELFKMTEGMVLSGISFSKGATPVNRAISDNKMFMAEIKGTGKISIGCATHETEKSYTLYITTTKGSVKNEYPLTFRAEAVPNGFFVTVPMKWTDGSNASYKLVSVPVVKVGMNQDLMSEALDFYRKVDSQYNSGIFADKLIKYFRDTQYRWDGARAFTPNQISGFVSSWEGGSQYLKDNLFIPNSYSLRVGIAGGKQAGDNYSYTSDFAKVDFDGQFGIKRTLSNGEIVFLAGWSTGTQNVVMGGFGDPNYTTNPSVWAILAGADGYSVQGDFTYEWLKTCNYPFYVGWKGVVYFQ